MRTEFFYKKLLQNFQCDGSEWKIKLLKKFYYKKEAPHMLDWFFINNLRV
jgi:hypothetical protein